MTGPRLRLALALAAFLAWMGYLGYAALNKSREPVLSQARLAAAKTLVVADVEAGPDGRPNPRVKGAIVGGADAAPFTAEIVNLPESQGFTGAGKYLLLLAPIGDEYRLVVPPRSPGYDHPAADKPLLYPWNADVQAQLERTR